MSAAEPFFATRLPRLVMFDLDGTLVDSVPDLTAAVDSMLASLGRPPAGIEKVSKDQWALARAHKSEAFMRKIGVCGS